MNTAEGADGLEKSSVERGNLLITTGGNVLFERLMTDRVQKSRYVDTVGAPRTAGMAGQAEPDAPGAYDPVYVPQNRKAYHLMRKKIHLRGYRATRGTFAALITLVNHR